MGGIPTVLKTPAGTGGLRKLRAAPTVVKASSSGFRGSCFPAWLLRESGARGQRAVRRGPGGRTPTGDQPVFPWWSTGGRTARSFNSDPKTAAKHTENSPRTEDGDPRSRWRCRSTTDDLTNLHPRGRSPEPGPQRQVVLFGNRSVVGTPHRPPRSGRNPGPAPGRKTSVACRPRDGRLIGWEPGDSSGPVRWNHVTTAMGLLRRPPESGRSLVEKKKTNTPKRHEPDGLAIVPRVRRRRLATRQAGTRGPAGIIVARPCRPLRPGRHHRVDRIGSPRIAVARRRTPCYRKTDHANPDELPGAPLGFVLLARPFDQGTIARRGPPTLIGEPGRMSEGRPAHQRARGRRKAGRGCLIILAAIVVGGPRSGFGWLVSSLSRDRDGLRDSTPQGPSSSPGDGRPH